jgi:hypothetical protein
MTSDTVSTRGPENPIRNRQPQVVKNVDLQILPNKSA